METRFHDTIDFSWLWCLILLFNGNQDGCVCWFDMRCKDMLFVMLVGEEPISSLCFKPGDFLFFIYLLVNFFVSNIDLYKSLHTIGCVCLLNKRGRIGSVIFETPFPAFGCITWQWAIVAKCSIISMKVVRLKYNRQKAPHVYNNDVKQNKRKDSSNYYVLCSVPYW